MTSSRTKGTAWYLRRVALFLFVIGLTAILASALWDFRDRAHYLIDLEWDVYLNQPTESALTFVPFCLRNTDCRGTLLKNTWKQTFSFRTYGIAALTLAALIISALARLAEQRPTAKDPGGGNFSTRKDLAHYLTDDPKDPQGNPRVGYLGFTENGQELNPRMQDRCTHVAVFAGTGGGKTTRIIKPSLIADAERGVSVLMIDPKWPDPRGGYSDVLSVFATHEYDVQIFCPFNDDTMHLPLISSIRNRQDARALATMFVPEPEEAGKNEGANFYRNLERQLLMFLFYAASLQKDYAISSIYNRLQSGPEDMKDWIQAHPEQELKKGLKGLLELRTESLLGIIQNLVAKLEAFNDPRLDAATQASTLPWKNLDPLALTKKRSALYVGIPNHVILEGDGKLLLGVFFRYFMRSLMMFAKDNGGTLPEHLAVYIDEFAHVGRINDATNWFGTLRSFKIGFTVAMQNRAQLELVYGETGAEALSGGNFGNLVTFPASLSLKDKGYISELMGEVTAEDTSRSTSREGIFGKLRRTKTYRYVARPLVSIEEMNRWPEDVGLLAPHGSPPTKIVAPQLHQRRAARFKNPYFSYSSTLGCGNSIELVRRLLTDRRHRFVTAPLSEAETRRLLSDESEVASPKDATKQQDASEKKRETKAPKSPPPPDRAEPEPAPVTAVTKPAPEINTNKKQTPPKREPSSAPKSLPNVPQGELMQSFRQWISSLRWKHVPVTVYTVRADGQNRVSKILFEELPGAMRHEHLDIWKKRRWIQVRREKLGIIGTGANVLCMNQIQSFMDSSNSQVIDVGIGDERVIVKARSSLREIEASETPTQPKRAENEPAVMAEPPPKVSEASKAHGHFTQAHRDSLVAWQKANRAACAFDHLYEHLRSHGSADDFKGVIQTRRFLLPKDTVVKLVGYASQAFPEIVLNGPNSHPAPYLEISADLALRLNPLQEWLTTHKAELERYASDDPPQCQPSVLGFYQPTLISVKRHIRRDELPHLPNTPAGGAEDWDRPNIYNSRPRMFRYAVQDAFIP